jgi:hypothetical protein
LRRSIRFGSVTSRFANSRNSCLSINPSPAHHPISIISIDHPVMWKLQLLDILLFTSCLVSSSTHAFTIVSHSLSLVNVVRCGLHVFLFFSFVCFCFYHVGLWNFQPYQLLPSTEQLEVTMHVNCRQLVCQLVNQL